MEMDGKVFENILAEYGFSLNVINVLKSRGSVTYELAITPSFKISQFRPRLADLSIAVGSPLRLIAPYKRGTIALEATLPETAMLPFEEALSAVPDDSTALNIPLGIDNTGKIKTLNIATAPHALIAGSSGSGKSSYLKTIIESLRKRHTPETLRLVLIDAKGVDFQVYKGDSFLYNPISPYSVVKSVRDADKLFQILIGEMRNRLEIFEKEGVSNIFEHNKLHKKLPYIVMIIDEFAELFSEGASLGMESLECYIVKLGQLSRAAGIHLIVATQRPAATVISNAIKVNFPTRISFRLPSKADYLTILPECPDISGKGASRSAWISSPLEDSLLHVITPEIPTSISVIQPSAASDDFGSNVYEKLSPAESFSTVEFSTKLIRHNPVSSDNPTPRNSGKKYDFKISMKWADFVLFLSNKGFHPEPEPCVIEDGQNIRDSALNPRFLWLKHEWLDIIDQGHKIGILTADGCIKLKEFNQYVEDDVDRIKEACVRYDRAINEVIDADDDMAREYFMETAHRVDKCIDEMRESSDPADVEFVKQLEKDGYKKYKDGDIL